MHAVVVSINHVIVLVPWNKTRRPDDFCIAINIELNIISICGGIKDGFINLSEIGRMNS